MIKPVTAICLSAFLAIAGCKSAGLDENGSSGLFGYPAGISVSSKAQIVEAKTQFRAENYNAAFDIFKEVLEADPSDSDAWLGYAASADRLQRFSAADDAYAKLAKLKPGDPTVYNNLGYSHLLRGNVKRAYAYLAQAKELAPGSQRIANNLQLLRSGSKSKDKR
ncbi:tetratricopeptide repeat protein [Fulvimarina sp. MAC3]|uniref:tetratricopeptide repeat protein n=1 Tax=Fulvimarina sp. MAC3 TaxID=3148887 RepID=UPI0031FC94A6